MILNRVILFIVGCCFFINLYAGDIKKERDGILLEIQKHKETDPQLIKIQVCAENIIRVTASPKDSFSTRKSLMLEKSSWEPVEWKIKEAENSLEIATSKLFVRINKESGEISFCNSRGELILEEKAGGGKIITAADVMGESTFHIQQLFGSPDDEAFYGLGAHQNNIWNYKGHDVDLWQYNIVDIIPFLVSSLPDGKAGRNYGILWHNNSRTKFGDKRDYTSKTTLKI